MELTMLAKVAWWSQALAILFILVCLFLIVIVLLQKGRGAGLSAAFGGAGGQSAFGTKTGDVFTWATIVIVAFFLLLSMALTVWYKPYDPTAQPTISSQGAPPVRQSQPETDQTDQPARDDAAQSPQNAPAQPDAASNQEN
jgi:preprotein translocase subunit SecG